VIHEYDLQVKSLG